MRKDVAAVSCSGYDDGDGRIDLFFRAVQACELGGRWHQPLLL